MLAGLTSIWAINKLWSLWRWAKPPARTLSPLGLSGARIVTNWGFGGPGTYRGSAVWCRQLGHAPPWFSQHILKSAVPASFQLRICLLWFWDMRCPSVHQRLHRMQYLQLSELLCRDSSDSIDLQNPSTNEYTLNYNRNQHPPTTR